MNEIDVKSPSGLRLSQTEHGQVCFSCKTTWFLDMSKSIFLVKMFLVFFSDVELTVPPRFALAGVMSSSGITTELVTFILAKRAAELDRFGLY